MIEQFKELAEAGSLIIAGLAAAVIVVGFVMALYRYFSRWSTEDREAGFHRLRGELGRALLIALEMLVVADVIDTIVTEVTVKSLSTLALLVVLRTILSWSLALQVEGKWPWQAEHDEKEIQNG
jgi:uncharacterized membrane protein